MSNPEEYIDVTFLVDDCASALTFQHPILCQEESFSLHDSMAALELLDRKMDCCELSAQQVNSSYDNPHEMVPPRQLPTGLNDPVTPLPWDDLTMDQVEAIGLEMLTRLEALLSGASVTESVYTCLYAHQAVLNDMTRHVTPSLTDQFSAVLSNSSVTVSVEQKVLLSLTLGLVELSDIIRNIVLHADIYEEEDFNVNTFGVPTDSLGQKQDVLEALKQGSKLVSSQCPLFGLFHYFHSFLEACSGLAKLASSSCRDIARQTKEIVQKGLHHLSNLKEACGSSLGSDVLKLCYDPFVFRPLVGSSPIRKISFKTTVESISVLEKVLAEISTSVCDLILEPKTLSQMRRFLNRVSLSNVNILSRSLIILNLYFEDMLLGQYSLGALVTEELERLCDIQPSQLVSNSIVLAFLNRLAKPTYDMLKLWVLNRNRQRQYLEGLMLADWAALQQEAHVVDVNLEETSTPFFSQYTLFISLWLMEHYVALGIELKLMEGHHDLAVAFWYRDFLLSSLLNTLSSMRRGKGTPRPDQPLTHDELQDEVDFMMIGTKRNLCRGSVRFIAALTQAGLVKEKTFKFTSDEERFRNRFQAFGCIVQPPMLTYDDFRAGSNFTRVKSEDLLASTADCFANSKKLLENIGKRSAKIEEMFRPLTRVELKNMTKICVGNSVFVLKLGQHNKSSGTDEPDVEFDFGSSSQFCIIKLK